MLTERNPRAPRSTEPGAGPDLHGGPTNPFPGGHRALEPPDPIPNSEVKRCLADDSVGPPHAKVGHRQVPTPQNPAANPAGFSFFGRRFPLLAGLFRWKTVVVPSLGAGVPAPPQ